MTQFVNFGESAEYFRPSLKTIFNGFNLDDELTDDTGSFITLSVSGRNDSEYDITTHEVVGLEGAIEEDNPTMKSRVITVRFRIKDETSAGLQRKFEKLRSFLEGSKKELAFTDDDFFFYATNQTLSVPDETSNNLTSAITFLCSDPYKYGTEKTVIFPSDIFAYNYEGTAETFPVYEMTVTAPITFAMIQNQLGETLLIGEPTNVEENAPYEKYELIFSDDGSDLNGWTAASAVDGGIVSGQMRTNGNRLEALSYGAGVKWHGPAIKSGLSETLQDFRMETYVELYNNQPNRVGRVEIYLLDQNDEVVSKLAMKDVESSQSLAWGEARAGGWYDGHFLINEYGDKPGNWNIFSGVLRIEREGNAWRAYFAKVGTDGRHSARRSAEWIDIENKYMQRVAKVQVHMAQFGTETPVQGGVSYIKVYKINNQPESTPYLANIGDVITFDTRNEEILINGEDAMQHKAFISSFFSLEKGENTLAVLPENSFEVKSRYRERRK